MTDKLRLVALQALLVTGACSSPPGERVDAGPPALTLGTGESTFQPLQEGGEISVYAGPQGGFHVFLSLRARGVDPGNTREPISACSVAGAHENPCLDFVAIGVDTGTELDVFVPLRMALRESPLPEWWQLQPSRLVQLDIAGLDELDGRMLTIRATLDDQFGVHVEEALDLTCVGVPLTP